MDIQHTDIALRLAGYNFKKKDLELIMRIIEHADENTTIEQIATIEEDVKQKYEK